MSQEILDKIYAVPRKPEILSHPGIDSENTDNKESESQKRNLKERSANIDDPTRGACNLGDYATNRDSTMLNHLQNHNDKSGE